MQSRIFSENLCVFERGIFFDFANKCVANLGVMAAEAIYVLFKKAVGNKRGECVLIDDGHGV